MTKLDRQFAMIMVVCVVGWLALTWLVRWLILL